MKRLTVSIAVACALAGAAHAGPFRDVPRKHWAYDAIQKLESSGLIRGRGSKFEGHRAFSRYEMAVVLARYMEKLRVAKGSILTAVEKTYPLMKKLAKEFSSELDLLGVKHQDLLARVTSLETRVDLHTRELEELRALVEENRRALQEGSAPRPTHARRPEVPRARPAGYAPHPPVYRTLEPPSFDGAGGPADLGGPTFLARAPRAPEPADEPLFRAGGDEGDLRVPDRLRLQNLRMRARALLDGREPPPPVGRMARAPEPRRRRSEVRPRPVSRSSEELMGAIDAVRSGSMDSRSAQDLGRRIESELSRSADRRSSSVVYPLTERLFGPAGLGPPAGD